MRKPKIWLRTSNSIYYVRIAGKQVPLGKDEDAAFKKYCAIMASSQPTTPATPVEDVLGKFLTWCKTHREPETYRWYLRHLASFREYIHAHHGKLKISKLKVFHVTAWLDSRYAGRGDNYRHNACRAVARTFNWAVREGMIESSPVKGMEKPTPHGREAYWTPEQWRKVIGAFQESDPFHDYLTILRETGCRPQEARLVEVRHFDRANGRWVFPVKESKGKRERRIVPLNNRALAITIRLALKYGDGHLFRNVDGNPLTKSAINCRFTRLKKKLVGLENLFAYAIRHTFITDALKRGVDPLTLATIVGHKDATMIMRVYSHLGLDTGHVRAALALATGEVPAKITEVAS